MDSLIVAKTETTKSQKNLKTKALLPLKLFPNKSDQFINLIRLKLCLKRWHAIATVHDLIMKVIIGVFKCMSGLESRNPQFLSFNGNRASVSVISMALGTLFLENDSGCCEFVSGRRDRRSR
ncbi:MAG TPA: hypothetical protein VIV66_08470 [Pyrinomonadaceae bacterium]